MNFITYKYFIAISQADSLKQAADALMISPQALSEHIRKLETELGVELLTHTRPARLTACGERFLRYAETMQLERYKLEKELRELSDTHREIVLSVSAMDFPPFLTDVLAAFTAQNPKCMVTIMERTEPVSISSLKAYDLNISSASLSNGMTEIILQGESSQQKSTNILSANCMAVLAHRQLLRQAWGAQYEDNMLRMLQSPELTLFHNVPFIRYLNPVNDVVMDELFLSCGFVPPVVAKTESSEMCVALCTSGVGAILIPDGWAMRKLEHQINDETLALFRLNASFPMMDTILSYRQDKTLTEEEQILIEMLQNYVAKM